MLPAPDAAEPPRPPSILPVVAIPAAAALLLLVCVRSMVAAQPRTMTVEEILAAPSPDGLAVSVPGEFSATPLGEDLALKPGEKSAHYLAFGDATTPRRLVLRLGRAPSPATSRSAPVMAETIEGTLRAPGTALAASLERAATDQGVELASPPWLLVDGELPPFPAAALFGAILAVAGGAALTGMAHRHRQMALEASGTVLVNVRPRTTEAVLEPIMPSDTAVSRSREAAFQQAISQAPCGVCGAMVQGFMKLCPNCKLPRQIEYYASASLPLAGFEKLTSTVMKTLGETEYQVARSLGRPHMPIPFSSIASLKERFQGGQTDTIHRLLAKGHPSFMAVQALKDELERLGTEVIVASSEDLARASRPAVAVSAEAGLDGVTFRLEDGASRTIPFGEAMLMVVYGEESTAETLTHRGGRSEASPSSVSRRNMLDIYTRSDEAGVRLHADRFDWAVLKERRTASPEANFGYFVEMVEARCPELVVHAVTDTHAGAWSEWRATYYSMWRALVSRRGADKGRGLLAIEGYRILGEVGRGAWGRVFKAVQDRVERTVAIKVLSSQFPRDDKFRERFFREARTAGQLNHPNVVAVIDCNEQRGLHYLVMEFVDGVTLKDLVKARGPFGERQALRATKAVARALEHAHGKGIVHRDIKPENVFLSREGHVKLGDWGLAKSYVSADANLTETGAAMGTPNYISPEQVKALKDLDHRVDIYSLGGTLYFLLTGSPPFPAGNVVEIMTRHLKDPPPDPRLVSPSVSEATAAIIARAMAKNPADRYATAAEMLAALEAVEVGGS